MTGSPADGRAKAAMMSAGGTRTWRSSPLWVLYIETEEAAECMWRSVGTGGASVPPPLLLLWVSLFGVGVADADADADQAEGGKDAVGVGGEGREPGWAPSMLVRSWRVSRRGFVESEGEAGLGGVRLFARGLGRAGTCLGARVASVGSAASLGSVSTVARCQCTERWKGGRQREWKGSIATGV